MFQRSKAIIIGALFLTTGIASLFLPIRLWFTQLEGAVQGLGVAGPIIVALAYVLLTILLVPGSVITIGAGSLFGLKTGLLVAVCGANLGALCSFLLARTFFRDKVAQWAKSNTKFSSFDRAIGHEGFKMVLLTRLSPVFPFNLLNYFLGLTAVRTGSYVLANLLGMLPAIFLLVYVGAAARDALTATMTSTGDFLQQSLKYAGLAATIGVVATVTRLSKRSLDEAKKAEGGPATPRPEESPAPFASTKEDPPL